MAVLNRIDKTNLLVDELADYLRDEEGLPVTRRQFRQAVLDRAHPHQAQQSQLLLDPAGIGLGCVPAGDVSRRAEADARECRKQNTLRPQAVAPTAALRRVFLKSSLPQQV